MSPVTVVPIKLPATVLPSEPVDPDASEGVAADQVSLARVARAIAVGPDQVVAGSVVDLDPACIGRGLCAGRVGAQEVAVDPVAGGSGPGDVDADAL